MAIVLKDISSPTRLHALSLDEWRQQSLNFSFTVQNTASSAAYIQYCFILADATVPATKDEIDHLNVFETTFFDGYYVKKNATTTFNEEVLSNFPTAWITKLQTERALQLRFLIYDYTSGSLLVNTEVSSFYFVDKLYAPTISVFALDRTEDEAETIKTSLKLTLADGLTETQKSRMIPKLVDGDGNEVTLHATLAQLLAGVDETGDEAADARVIQSTYSKESDHYFTLTFGDEYESVSAPADIDRSFANVHLSGHTDGGVTFGGFCDRNNPGRFECYYPAFFYGGINIGGGSSSTVNISENVVLCGHLTGSSKHIYVSAPIGLAALSATTATVTNMVGWVRCAGKYGKSASYVDGGDDYTSLVTSTVLDQATGIVTIIIERSSAFYGSNNTALTFTVKTLTIELS